jgi:phosphoglycolate phosphatase
MDYQTVLWDFNGTLMDDAWLCLDVMNGMLSRRGLKTLSPQHYADIFDFPVEEYYRRAGWDPEMYPFESLSDEFMAGYHARKLDCKLRPEAASILGHLHALEVPQAIISASQMSMVEELLAHFEIAPYFDSIHALDNHHAAGKLEIGLAWIEESDLEPESVLLIGDTTHDAEVAEAMGVDCVLIFSGHQARERLAATGARVVDHLDQIGFE